MNTVQTKIQNTMREAELEKYRQTVESILWEINVNGYSKENAIDRVLSNTCYGTKSIAEIISMVDGTLAESRKLEDIKNDLVETSLDNVNNFGMDTRRAIEQAFIGLDPKITLKIKKDVESLVVDALRGVRK